MSTQLADASPDKAFFVDSITKDISLLDCVLDLIDNSIDSAANNLQPGDILNTPDCLKGCEIAIAFDSKSFSISDNANGIALKDAIETVFRFGSIKKDNDHESIGYYGIGLKRATFKIGRKIVVHSTTSTETFDVLLDIDDWLSKQGEWSFPIIDNQTGTFTDTGVQIKVQNINPEISESFNASSFKIKLIETIGRDYYFFLKAGLKIKIGGDIVAPAELEIKDSDDFKPGFKDYLEDNVHVTILSGCHSKFEEQNSDDTETFDPKVSGWYVICNNRIILAANKDDKTIWKGKHEGFTYWHPQYNGFVGFIFFNSTDQKKLPWTTTKRYVDLESNVYRAALPTMLEMTKPWIQYTSHRKANIDAAKMVEQKSNASSLAKLATASLRPKEVKPKPSFPIIDPAEKIELSSIAFKIEKYKVEKSKSVLGNPSMNNADLGKYAFNYLYKNEIDS